MRLRDYRIVYLPLSLVLYATETMNQYQDSAGRITEILVGIITTFICVVFVLLVIFILKEAPLSFPSVFGTLLLSVMVYWFGMLSYRLLLNKTRKKGGLLSPLALKVFCLIFGICSIAATIFALISGEFNAAISSAIMVPACFVGWKLAKKRQKGSGI